MSEVVIPSKKDIKGSQIEQESQNRTRKTSRARDRTIHLRKRSFGIVREVVEEFFLEGEWCIARDFNTIKNEKERKGRGSHVNRRETGEFYSFIDSFDLMGIPASGNIFTMFKPSRKCDR